MLFRNRAYEIMSGRLLAEKDASPFVPLSKEVLEVARKRGDVLVYVPDMSMNDMVKRHRNHFMGDVDVYEDAGFMRTKHKAAWWIVGVGPFVQESVVTTPRRAPAVVLVYACIQSQEQLGEALFTGVATTGCIYTLGGPILYGNPFRTIAVRSHDTKISVVPILECDLPKDRRTAFGTRGTPS